MKPVNGEPMFLRRGISVQPLYRRSPGKTLIGEALLGDARTYFIYDHSKSTRDRFVIPVNRVNTEKRIERQRKVLYWSLGLLYCSYP